MNLGPSPRGLDVARIPPLHPLELHCRHLPPGVLAPVLLGAGDKLGAQAFVETMAAASLGLG